MNDLKNKRIGILGLGDENIALVRYLEDHGTKNISICDRKKREELMPSISQISNNKNAKIDYQLGPDYLENLQNFDIVFRSPGLPYLNKKIQKAKKAGVEISSSIKLFFSLCPSPICGITGTKGKGTTASLIYKILSQKFETKHQNVYLGGNIGNSPMKFVDELSKDDIVILELSSFQLQDLDTSPQFAVILDIKSDHLDYHQNQEEYIKAKKNIVNFQNSNDFAIINADYPVSSSFADFGKAQKYWISKQKEINQGAYVEKDNIVLKIDHQKQYLLKTSEVLLRGRHNLENICASVTAAYLLGADVPTIIEVVKNFKGLEHRLENFAEINNVKFYNDSYSTIPDTTIAAIRSFHEPIILICGGSEKNADYSELGKIIRSENVKTAILIGKTGPRIKESIERHESRIKRQKNLKIIDTCNNLDDIIKVIKTEIKPGDVVLFSPASASFDWFNNYKERGEKFKNAVLNLKKAL